MNWFWLPTKAFWRKFCGVSDEYEMLKDRWNTLSTDFGRALPSLKSTNNEKGTFTLIDELETSLEEWFSNIALLRHKEVSQKEVLPKLVQDYGSFEKKGRGFFDFCTYIGLIKHAFFQRTVSLEIPQLESAVPHSPERTMGNEMFYATADCLAKEYSKCIKTPEISWDGFITFMPAIGEEGFYGAFFRPSDLLKLFHISMSEEQKYYLGTYLALAHEFGHAAIVGSTKDARRPLWFKTLYLLATGITMHYLSRCRNNATCLGCELKDLDNSHLLLRPFEDFIADVFALRIGGVNTIHSLLDFAPGFDVSIIRSNAILGYMIDQGFQEPLTSPLKSRIMHIQRKLTTSLPTTIKSVGCVQCWKKIGECWASSIRRYIESSGRDPISAIVLKEFDHNFQYANKDSIEKALVDGKVLTEVEPRVILSVYHDLISNDKNPNYSATIYNIMYNENVESLQMRTITGAHHKK